MSGSDLALLEQWHRRHDAEAFREIALRHAGMVYAACKRILGSAADAEDVAQECFLRLAREANPPDRHLGAWLHRVATNLARNHARAEGRRKERERRYVAETLREVEIQWDNVASLVDEAIAQLSEELRAPLVSHFLEGQSQTAIARASGLSQQAISHRIEKAVDEVRSSLEKRGVSVATASLSALLAANACEAAPASLMAALGKIAILGSGGTLAAGAVAVKSAGWLAGVAASGKAVMATAVVALALGGTWLGVNLAHHSRESVPAVQAPVAAQPVADVGLPEVALAGTNEEPSALVDETASGHAGPPAAAPPTSGEKTTALISGTVVDASSQPVVAREGEDQRPEEGVNVSASWTRADDGGHYQSGTGLSRTGSFQFQSNESSPKPNTRLSLHARREASGEVSDIAWFTLPPEGLHDVVLKLTPGGSVSGTVSDKVGRPVGGLRLHLVSTDNSVSVEAKGDENGVFLFKALPPGTFTITCTRQGHHLHFTDGGPIEANVALGRGQHVKDLALVIPTEVIPIAGDVRDLSGKPVVNVRVEAQREASDRGRNVAGGGWSDEKGHWKLSVDSDGSYTVTAHHNDYAPVSTSVKAGDSRVELVFRERAGVIEGQVLRAQDNQPVPTFTVMCTLALTGPQGETSRSGNQGKVTDQSEGRFEVTVQQTATVSLTAQAPGYAPKTLDIGEFTPPRRMTGVVLRLDPAMPLTGIVVDAEGRPVAGASILKERWPLDLAFTEHNTLALTQADGQFTIDPSKADISELTAYHSSYPPKTITLEKAGARSEPLRFVLSRGAMVEGTVTRGNRPLAGEKITISASYESDGRHGSLTRRTKTDGEGKYRVTGLPEGQATVRMEMRSEGQAGRPAMNSERRVEVREGERAVMDFAIPEATAMLRGRVLIGGKPASPQNLVSLRLVQKEGDRVAVSLNNIQAEPDGSYVFADAPTGACILTVTVEGARTRNRQIPLTLAANQTATCDVNLAPADATIEGRILMPGELPQRVSMQASVETPDGKDLITMRQNPGAMDAFKLEGLPAGTAVVSAQIACGEGRMMFRSFTCETRSGQTTYQDIVIGSGRLAVNLSDGNTPGRAFGVVVLSGKVSWSDVAQARLPDLNALAGMRAMTVAQPGLSPIAGLEPGTYTVIGIAVNDRGDPQGTTLAEFPHSLATVQVTEGQEAQVELVIGQ